MSSVQATMGCCVGCGGKSAEIETAKNAIVVSRKSAGQAEKDHHSSRKCCFLSRKDPYPVKCAISHQYWLLFGQNGCWSVFKKCCCWAVGQSHGNAVKAGDMQSKPVICNQSQ